MPRTVATSARTGTRRSSPEQGSVRGSYSGPLLPSDYSADMRTRWEAIQTGFVDDPRIAVQQADELVAAAIKKLAESFRRGTSQAGRGMVQGQRRFHREPAPGSTPLPGVFPPPALDLSRPRPPQIKRSIQAVIRRAIGHLVARLFFSNDYGYTHQAAPGCSLITMAFRNAAAFERPSSGDIRLSSCSMEST